MAAEQRLSAQRIYQDLVSGEGFPGNYTSVKRFVRRLRPVSELPFRRWESAPGEEAQVDFGQGAWVGRSYRVKDSPVMGAPKQKDPTALSAAVGDAN